MEQNILLAGVGGQGILSVAFVICNAALKEGLNFKQSEIHGMAQRGGAVQSMLRLSSKPVASDLIPKGTCHLLLSVEPLEALRYLDYLGSDGVLITSTNPFVNIPNYPDINAICNEMKKVADVIPIDADAIAKQVGSSLVHNMVMLGAGSECLALKLDSLENWVKNLWQAKGDKIVEINLNAFRAGRRMAIFLRAVAKAGADLTALRALASGISIEAADAAMATSWARLLKETHPEKWTHVLSAGI